MDPFSVVAGAFSVTDAGARASTAIGSLVHDWTTSSEDITALRKDIADIKASIARVRRFCDSANGQRCQQDVLKDLEARCKRTEGILLEVDEITKELISTTSGALPTKSKLRWVRKKSSIKCKLASIDRSRDSVIELYTELRSESYQREVVDGLKKVHDHQSKTSHEMMQVTQDVGNELRLRRSTPRSDTGSAQSSTVIAQSSAVSAVSTFVVDSLVEDADTDHTLPKSTESSVTFDEPQYDTESSSSQNDYSHMVHTRRIRRGSICNDHCRCACHEKQTRVVKSSPFWVQRLFGSVFVAVYRLPQNQCDVKPCRSSGSKAYEFRWTLPFWLPHRQLEALVHSGSPPFYLAIRRRVGFFDENSLLRLAWSGDATTTQLLIDRGLAFCDDMETHNGRTALEMAIDGRKLRVIQILLRNGAKLDIESDNRKSPGDYAAELILTRNAPADLLDFLENVVRVRLGDYTDDWAWTDLHRIVIFRSGALRSELERRPELRELIDEKDRTGRTPLHWAALMGDEAAISVLILAQADVDARDESAATPLHEAARSHNPRALQMLMAARPDCRATNKLGQMAIHIVALRASHQHAEFLSPFVLGMHSLEEPSKYSKTTPFGYAAMADKVDMMTHLAKLGVCMSSPDEDGDTPLFEAINFGSYNAIRFLLHPSRREHSGYKLQNNSGHNLLHKAARKANATVLRILANECLSGINPDALDGRGKTPRDLLLIRSRHGLLQDGLEDAFEELLQSVRDATKEEFSCSASTLEVSKLHDIRTEEKIYEVEETPKLAMRSRWNPLGWFM